MIMTGVPSHSLSHTTLLSTGQHLLLPVLSILLHLRCMILVILPSPLLVTWLVLMSSTIPTQDSRWSLHDLQLLLTCFLPTSLLAPAIALLFLLASSVREQAQPPAPTW